MATKRKPAKREPAATYDAWLNEDDDRAAKIAAIDAEFDGELPRVQMNRKEICRAFGLTNYALDELIAQGCPVLQKGNQRTPWKLEPDLVLNFIIKLRCGLLDDADATQAAEYRTAKTRKMKADADRVEMQNAAVRAETLTVDEVVSIYQEESQIIRDSLNAIPGNAVRALGSLKPDERRNASMVESILDDVVNQALTAISGTEHASA
jgi:phage terminase Nu1 subunit (DNA packaging protein)